MLSKLEITVLYLVHFASPVIIEKKRVCTFTCPGPPETSHGAFQAAPLED